jgi:hypothetical protein
MVGMRRGSKGKPVLSASLLAKTGVLQLRPVGALAPMTAWAASTLLLLLLLLLHHHHHHHDHHHHHHHRLLH